MKNTIWYFGLEPVKSRYTEQLSEHWMPDAFRRIIETTGAKYQLKHVRPEVGVDEIPEDIRVGVVLDAVGRSITS